MQCCVLCFFITAATSLLYHIFRSLSSLFSKFFEKLFLRRSFARSRFASHRWCSPLESLSPAILPLRRSLTLRSDKDFLYSSFNVLFLSAFRAFCCPLVRQLYYYITLFLCCQHLFMQNNFNFYMLNMLNTTNAHHFTYI